MRAWGLATSIGMEAQVKALAGALHIPLEMKHIKVRTPFVWLPNVFFAAGLKQFVFPYMLTADSHQLQNPWPDVVISCGRRAAIAALGLQHFLPLKGGGGRTRFIHIQDPLVNPKHFDLVIAMQHDAIKGANVLHTEYALHSITPQKLKEAVYEHAPVFASYPRPYVSVLLGGSTNKYTLTGEAMQAVIATLRAMLASMPGSLLITVSRRTDEKTAALLKEIFNHNPRVYIYDGKGENPYFGLLGVADAIAVSNDSVNMMSEAAATGKPFYCLPLLGHHHTKPADFSEKLLKKGIARVWDGTWESWPYDITHEMKTLPQQIQQKLSL